MFKSIIVHHHIKDNYFRGMTPQQFIRQFLKYKDTYIFSFDDGLKEGYTVAFPYLKKYEVTGYFFPIGETLRGCVNHVHKGHILLNNFNEELIELWNENSLQTFKYSNTQVEKYTLDTPKIAAFKKWLFQKVSVREKNNVFDQIMKKRGIDISVEDYYLTETELKEMHDAGMVIGNHTLSHPNLKLLDPEHQKDEIFRAQKLIHQAIGVQPTVFCYPYGAYNKDTLIILNELEYNLGLTTNSLLEVGRVDCKKLAV